ncbi:MAG: helix-turn-helix transcriptional regulator [Proteobacteria bacterium]|nr:helix-turn-helix transcriptional regulator [Pseudomonadota bacterium]
MGLPELAAVLRRSAKERGITQEALREASGISRQTLTNVLSGHSDYKVTTLLSIADRLGYEVVLVPKMAARGLEEWETRPPIVKSQVEAALERLKRKVLGEGEGSL